MATDETSKKWWTLLWISLCILIALAVRSHNLGAQSLWWDESLSLLRAHLPLADILSNRIDLTDNHTVVATIDNHPPLYFVLLSLSVRLFGSSEFALRLLSLACGILLIPLLYVAGKRLVGDAAGCLAALMAALSPMYLWYSQEARMYMLAPLIGLLSFYALLRLIDREATGRQTWAVVYILATIAMLLTHYLTFFILAVEILIAILAGLRGSRLLRWLWPLVIVGLLAVLILIYGLSIMPPSSAQGGFTFVPLQILARDLLNSFSLGLSVNVEDVIFLDFVFLLVALSGLLASIIGRHKSPLPGALILLLYMIVPIGLTYMSSYVRPLYMNSRHLIMITPAFYLALGAGLSDMRARRGIFLGVCAVMLIGIVFSWSQYFTNPVYAKDDHRGWGDFLRANVQPGDVVVVDPPHIAELYQYYAGSDIPWLGLPVLDDANPAATEAVLDRLGTQYKNIWLAQSYTPAVGDPDRIAEKWLERVLVKTEDRSFHSYASIVRLERYATRPPLALAPPPISVPADILLDGRLQYLGYDAVNQTAQPGRSLAFSVYLRHDAQASNDLKISLRLLDETGQLWAQSDRAIAALLPAGRWREGTIMREDVNLLIPLATPEGAYHVEAVVYSSASGQPLLPNRPGPIALGEATVAKPNASPLPALLPFTQRVSSCAAQLELMGVQIASGQLFEGDLLAMQAFWLARQAPISEYLAHVALVDSKGAVVAEKTFPMSTPAHGTLTWARGEIVRGQYALELPRDVAAGVYTLRFSLDDVSRNIVLPLKACGVRGIVPGASAGAVRITINDRPRSFVAPALAYPLHENLGASITMLGYDVYKGEEAQRLAPGDSITVTIHLQARTTMDADYAIFVHLLDESGRIDGQQDSLAGGNAHPTTRWLQGEVVSTTLTAMVSPQMQTGRLTVIMGLYDPNTQVRLPVSGASVPTDYITLFNVDVLR